MKNLIRFTLAALALSASPAHAQWTVLDTPWPSGPVTRAFLTDVEVFANDDVWAVGYWDEAQPGGGSYRRTLTLHWSGSAWSIVPAPSPSNYAELRAVEGAASDDVWAVGVRTGTGFNPQALLLHWDGSAWSEVPTPMNSASFSGLNDLEVLASDDVWFVGNMNTTGPLLQTLPTSMHWDGTGFTVATAPTLNTNGHDLNGIVAFPSGEVWAVGGGPQSLAIPTYVVRWTGTAWQVVSAPQPGFVHDLDSIDGVSPDDLWAVGTKQDANGIGSFTLHYDGTQWTEVVAPGGGSDLLAVGPDEVYRTGSAVYRWDGTTWSVSESFPTVDAPNPRGIDRGPDGTLWTVGARQFGNVLLTFSARLDGALTEFCSGDGGDQLGCTDCPCGNAAPAGTVGGCLNSSGRGAVLVGSGLASATADTLRFTLEDAPSGSLAVLVSGATQLPSSPANPCFGLGSGVLSVSFDGLRCVGGGTRRHGERTTDANGTAGVTTPGWGPPDGPAAGLVAQGGFASGETRFFQVFFRELPAAVCMRGLNTSNGVSVVVAP